MIRVRKPEPYEIREFLADQAASDFTYAEVGATNGELPDGYFVNQCRRQVGTGMGDFLTACAALESWTQLRLGWVDCWPSNARMQVGEKIAVLGRAFGLWWVNACRIVYTIDERGAGGARFGYAHGTLANHLATGEERFLVELDENEEVWIDIVSFSRPRLMAARLGYPLMKRAQRRFLRDSASQIAKQVQRGMHPPLAASGGIDRAASVATQSAGLAKERADSSTL